MTGSYPIKLFYTSNIPIILQALTFLGPLACCIRVARKEKCSADGAGLQPVLLLPVPPSLLFACWIVSVSFACMCPCVVEHMGDRQLLDRS